jgi:hypothetical protein
MIWKRRFQWTPYLSGTVFSLNELLTLWSGVSCGKSVVTQLIKKFTAFMEHGGSSPSSQDPTISSYSEPVQFTLSHTISLRYILILFSNLRLCLQLYLFPLRFSEQNFVQVYLISTIQNVTSVLYEECKSWGCLFLQSSGISYLLIPQHFFILTLQSVFSFL